jgi:adenylate kinase family enzyme
MRINVTGNAGAGKSTLTQQLGEVLDLPVFSLDSIVWQPGWQKTPALERQAREQQLIDQPSWIIDGVSVRIRQASDIVVFLDVPRHVCAWRAVKRSVRYFNCTRPGLPPNCPEWRILPRLMVIIWQFPYNAGRAIRREALHVPGRYFILGQDPDLRAIVTRIETA